MRQSSHRCCSTKRLQQTGPVTKEAVVQSKLNDKGRIWLWGFLAILATSQLYVVRELLVAFAFFALVFATIAVAVASLYMLQNCWQPAMARLAAIRRPLINMPAVSREHQKAA
jgi:hypothetical protein